MKLAYLVVRRHGAYEGFDVEAVWLNKVDADSHRDRLNGTNPDDDGDLSLSRYAVYTAEFEPLAVESIASQPPQLHSSGSPVCDRCGHTRALHSSGGTPCAAARCRCTEFRA